MAKQLILMSGMPASGKDTVTEKLVSSHPQFIAFKKHRGIHVQDIPKSTYYNISYDEFESRIRSNEFLQYHLRYGRYYGVSKRELLNCFEQKLIPIIHVGRLSNFFALKEAIMELEKEEGFTVILHHILLWESKETLTARIMRRSSDKEEIKKRINAMNQEFEDNIAIMNQGMKPFTIVIKNTNSEETSRIIFDLICNAIIAEKVDGYIEFQTYLENLQ